MAPGRRRRPGLPARSLGAGFGAVTGVLTKILGAQVLKDVQTFVAALDTMFGGFRERADATYRLLQAAGHGVPGGGGAGARTRCARRRTSSSGSPRRRCRWPGLVLNRVHGSGAGSLSADAALGRCRAPDELGEHPSTAGLLRVHAERMRAGRGRAALRLRPARFSTRASRSVAGRRGGRRCSPPTCTTWTACGGARPRDVA